jgi:predicted ATPase
MGTADDYLAIARICHLVGGIPLGIELAASWARLLACAEIADEIEKGLDFLTVTVRDMPSRHHSLRAVFDYSWQLLSSTEQQALARLSLFSGGFTREASAKVAGANLQILSALTDRSLLQRTAVGRYNLHSLVRQYAHDHLQAEPERAQTAAQKHSDYYLQWLAEKDPVLRSGSQKEALLDVTLELSNIRVAWQQAVNTRQFPLLRSAAFALSYYYELRDLLQAAESTFRTAADQLGHTPDATSHDVRLTVNQMHTHQAYFGARLGQPTAVIEMLEPVIAELQELGDERVLAYGLRYLALAQYINGRYDEALEVFQQSLALAKRLNRQWEMAITQASITMVLHEKGNIEEAQPYAKAALANSRNLGDLRLISFSLILAGRSNLELNQLDDASEQLEQSLVIGEETNDLHIINRAYLTLALVRRAQGDFTAARLLLRKSMDLLAHTNDLVGAERISVNMGLVEMDAGNLATAKTLFLSLLQMRQHEHPSPQMLTAVTSLAFIRNQEGDPFTALVWTLFVLQQPNLDIRSQRHAQNVRAELESQLTAAEIAAAQMRADQQTIADITAEAKYS